MAESSRCFVRQGHGRTGYGTARLRGILGHGEALHTAAQGAEILQDEGAVAAYAWLRGRCGGWGPAFFTKYLYFVGTTVTATGQAPAILDRRVARAIRPIAEAVATELDVPDAPGLAAWTWSDGGWTGYRYSVYLACLGTVTAQMAGQSGWPHRTDAIELALFSGALKP